MVVLAVIYLDHFKNYNIGVARGAVGAPAPPEWQKN